MGNIYDICCEKHYGRKSKVTFKGIVCGLLVGATLIGPAGGVVANAAYTNEIQSIQQTYGVSFEAAKSSIENTIGQIESLRASNQVSDSLLQKLASSLYQLDSATNKSDSKAVDVLLSTVDKSEQSIQGLPDSRGKTAVQVAVDSIREGLGVFTFAASSIKAAALGEYSDTANHWAKDTIKRAGELDLMQGMGDGTFSPDTEVSVAQFTTICVRAIGKDSDARAYGGSDWFSGYMTIAEKYGLIDKGQFTDPNRAMTRAEMSYLAMNVMKFNGETPKSVVPISSIPDLGENGKYMNSIQFSYSAGVLVGVDSTGRFDGNGVLTRAAAATVAVRLLGEQRQVPNFNQASSGKQEQTPISGKVWTEGQKHGVPAAGDTVTTKSGQTIVLTEKWGIVGVGQDVDIWTGVGPFKVGSSGLDGSSLQKAKYTNETHTVTEWSKIMANSQDGLPDTGTEGQIANDFWEWDSNRGMWGWVGGGSHWK